MSNFVKHPGALHRALGIPEDEKIPEIRLIAAAHSRDPAIRRMANYALHALRVASEHSANRPKKEREAAARKGTRTREKDK
jgi:hypothetical protein